MNESMLYGERSQVAELYGLARQQYLQWLRTQIIQNDRIDLLANVVLGYEVHPFHLHMMRVQFLHPNNLQLVGRGFGKSTICTVTKTIHTLIKYPKARIVIASKTVKQSQARLKEVTSHFVGNDLLIELFGEFYNHELWNAREIEILQRHDPKNKNSPGASSRDSTPSVACVGAKGSIAGAHFDIEFSDDLIDKTNSNSTTTRDEFTEWYNGTFTPMLDPPDPDIPFRGERHRVGTRYHYLDQYGTWIKQAREAHQAGVPDSHRMWIEVIPAIDYRDTSHDPLVGKGLGVYTGKGTGKSPWPKRWPIKELNKRKSEIGRIAFEAQYLNDIDSMNGEIFSYENFQEIDVNEVEKLYPSMTFYIGVDLAISEKKTADDSAFVVIGVVGRGSNSKVYVVETKNGKMRFNAQTELIKKLHDKWNGIGAGVKKIGIETVAYQQAQFQNLEDRYPAIKKKLKRVLRKAGEDKVSRAWAMTPLIEAGRLFLPTQTISVAGEPTVSTPAWQLREQMVLLPNGQNDDLWDAFDNAFTLATKKARKPRKEFGVL